MEKEASIWHTRNRPLQKMNISHDGILVGMVSLIQYQHRVRVHTTGIAVFMLV